MNIKQRNSELLKKAKLLRKNNPTLNRKQFAKLLTISTITESNPKGITTALTIVQNCLKDNKRNTYDFKFKATGRPVKGV